jgi:hypothetical protein
MRFDSNFILGIQILDFLYYLRIRFNNFILLDTHAIKNTSTILKKNTSTMNRCEGNVAGEIRLDFLF